MSEDLLKMGTSKIFKFIGKIILCLVCIAGLFFIGKYAVDKHDERIRQELIDDMMKDDQPDIPVTPNITIDKNTLLKAIAPAAELVTSTYYYTDADVYEKAQPMPFLKNVNIPFTTDKTVFIFTGQIKVGIKDLNEVEFDIDDNSKKILVKLPKLQIISNDIDDHMQTIVVSDSIITETNLDEYNEFRNVLKEREVLKVKANSDYEKYLKENTEKVLTDFIKLLTDDYNISFEWIQD